MMHAARLWPLPEDPFDPKDWKPVTDVPRT